MTGVRKVAVASAVGNTIELYDFLLYGTASALVFNKIFFPQFDSRVGVLLAFATFGAGFVARPLGGAVIGHLGDRFGRRAMLVITLSATGLATALIGLLPSYASIGIAAPVLLVLLRIVQGFFMGGEQGGASLMAVEHAPPGRWGWYGSWVFIGSPVGLVLANLAMYLSSRATGPDFLSWGWRLPFLFSIVLVGIGLYIRLRVSESPRFARAEKSRMPLVEVVRTRWQVLLLGAGVNLGFQIFIFVLSVFTINYGRTALRMSPDDLLVAQVLGGLAQVVAVPVFAWLSDRIGRLPVMFGGAVFQAAFAFPMFWLMDVRWFTAAIVLGFVGSGALFGPMAAYFAELFRTRVRYSGVAVSYQLGAVLGGGLAPFVATSLLAYGTWAVALYLIAGAVLSGVCLLVIGSAHEAEPAGGESDAQPLTPAEA
ncbi:putative MFS family arabinose efflux permease [Lentzea atacamensis]|uniref:MFS family arabinose efflux permease n=1 Tax=Lentzea atacamensis TaxID=531938 RepID=A0A316HVZ7_9PSEU|nr:putative MFS family arabinose efflux permease [Lentzea atacamensis]RAS69164.1 putative MFS family arabinose efflux permease [Lentzea atacamensis]